MALVYKDGQHLRMFCAFCGCRVDGTIRQFGVKWIWDRHCGHERKFLGYIQPPDVLQAKGWLKSFNDLPPDPAIEARKQGIAREKYIEQEEKLAYIARCEQFTRPKFL